LKKHCVKKYFAVSEYEECKNPSTGKYLPYDIAITQYNLFIEVQGGQHYEFTPKFHPCYEDFKYQQFKDKIKREYAKRNGIFLEIDLRVVKDRTDAINIVEKEIEKIVKGFHND
jgi:hypothetical protein